MLRDHEATRRSGYRPFHRRYVSTRPADYGVAPATSAPTTMRLHPGSVAARRSASRSRRRIAGRMDRAEDKLFDVQTQASWNFAPRIGAALTC